MIRNGDLQASMELLLLETELLLGIFFEGYTNIRIFPNWYMVIFMKFYIPLRIWEVYQGMRE